MLRFTVSLLALLLSAPALAKGHPRIDASRTADACESCHAEATPEAVTRWESGKHGLVLVKCFVCHGSTGKDFALRPAAARCAGCHPDQVAAVVPAKAAGKQARGTGCFSCHEPHSLAPAAGAASPHGAR